MVIDKVLVIASAVIKNKQGKILLLQRSDKSSYPGYWQLVEGKLEQGELPTETIKRETEEEVNAKATNVKFSNIFYKKLEAKGLKYLCFRVVFNSSVDFKKLKTSDEHTSFGWFGKKEIKDLPLLPGTKDILETLFD